MCDELAAHLASRPHDADDHVWTGERGGLLNHKWWYTHRYRPVVETLSAKGKLPTLPAPDEDGNKLLRFHDLRHTCVALLIAKGAQQYEVRNTSVTRTSKRPSTRTATCSRASATASGQRSRRRGTRPPDEAVPPDQRGTGHRRQRLRDGAGMFGTSDVHKGVFLSDVPLDANEGATGDDRIAVDIDEDDIAEFEWAYLSGHSGYREWCVPSEIVNTRATITLLTAAGEQAWFAGIRKRRTLDGHRARCAERPGHERPGHRGWAVEDSNL